MNELSAASFSASEAPRGKANEGDEPSQVHRPAMHSRSGTAHPKLVSKIRQVAITDLNGEIVSLPFGKRPRSGPKVRPLLLEFDEGGGEEPLGSSGIACTKAAFELALADERAVHPARACAAKKMLVAGCCRRRAIAKAVRQPSTPRQPLDSKGIALRAMT